MVFNSKIDLHLAVMLLACLAFPLILGSLKLYQADPEGWIAIGGGFVVLLSYGLIFPCKYTLHEEYLHVKCGWSTNEKIPYRDMIKIEKSKSLWSSPALSLKRLSIRTRKGETIISPQNLDYFMLLLNQKISQNKVQATA